MGRHRLHQIEDLGVLQARLAAETARQAWLDHISDRPGPPCVQCAIASTRRASIHFLCPTGRELRRERDDAAEQLRREHADAAKPNPDQASLFDMSDLGGQ